MDKKRLSSKNTDGEHYIRLKMSLFCRPVWVAFFAITAAVAWGWAYPLIKLGFANFGIKADMTASKMLFAGVRFCISGVLILLVAACRKSDFSVRKKRGWWFVLMFSLFNTTLHYAFFYFGLSHSAGSRAAILNSMSVFVVVLLACLFFPSDRLTLRKVCGCVMGATGILALNIGTYGGEGFSWLGDGMIALNALCGATAGLLTRPLSKRVDIFVGTGYSLAIGGLLLSLPGLAMGGTLPVISLGGIVILMLLIAISTVGFTLYNKLLSCNPVGKVAIYNSLIPVVGAVTSCLCLGEPFYWKYVVAGSLAAGGIYVINKGKK